MEEYSGDLKYRDAAVKRCARIYMKYRYEGKERKQDFGEIVESQFKKALS